MVTTGSAVLAPSASADSGNVVTFGDSFSANPDQVRNTLRDIPGPLGDWARDYPSTGGCLQSPNNVAGKIRNHGYTVRDWSCTAQTSGSMLGRIDAAISAGDIHNDSTVVMSIGMNDYGPFGAMDNHTGALLDPAGVSRAYKENMVEAAAKIRKVAPDAHLVVSGALPTTDRDSMMFCPLNVIPDMPLGFPIPALRDAENWNRTNQKEAAKDIGATYVEMIDGARGHDSCSPDTQRYVAGIIDTTTPNYNMAFHPSDRGSEYMADQIVAKI